MTRTRKFEEIVKGMNYVSVKLTCWKASNVVLNTESSHALSFSVSIFVYVEKNIFFCFPCTMSKLPFFLRKGPGCPFDSQDPHWCSGENQHSPQTYPWDEEMGSLIDHRKSR